MSEFSEGMAVGQSIGYNTGAHNGCYGGYGIPMMPAYGGYGMGGFGGYGGDGWWILLLLLCGGWGNGGWGGNNGQFMNYEIGRLATTNDVASGFNNSAVLNNLNDLKLGQSQGFAGVQQTLCQGFSGINQTVMNGFHGVDNAICTLGYNTQTGFNGLSRQIADCCCDLKTMNLENRYLNEKQTCDIIGAINNGNQRLLDYWNCKETQELRDKLQAANFQISQMNQNAFITANQDAQTAELIRRLGRDCPTPAYLVPNPNCCYDQASLFGARQGCCG